MKNMRTFKLTDKESRKQVDLREYESLIISTIENVLPGKNPRVYSDHFVTDELTQGESIILGKALSKERELAKYGKQVTTFRLFQGMDVTDKEENN